jgi:hypothetical protein
VRENIAASLRETFKSQLPFNPLNAEKRDWISNARIGRIER